ncbi:uncharacterized protein AMSG_03184 [Thecamonas trahens ATCC 50062]|uniref:Zn(2)-C6 fungal-type domain-containing protein n=1 Tax=Thecamonas trahens ATCC 50062 TaxID=461836 RepID=A0A0L0D3H5_THETB|nr:hypothetical protein AMSG_03184 [Thecamonas trahens ATCC 50062]KNC46755.1 hypothetical protein AMSG_03184 [Thecamonas trahens ATCC 50062]|eukprot:XP_013760035.1 hypothetical protein AMSG_03184 [Thecamonas trahens ATCC 50062]
MRPTAHMQAHTSGAAGTHAYAHVHAHAHAQPTSFSMAQGGGYFQASVAQHGYLGYAPIQGHNFLADIPNWPGHANKAAAARAVPLQGAQATAGPPRPPTGPAAVPRKSRSCDRCRASKRKCVVDDGAAACRRCLGVGASCTWLVPPKKRGPKPKSKSKSQPQPSAPELSLKRKRDDDSQIGTMALTLRETREPKVLRTLSSADVGRLTALPMPMPTVLPVSAVELNYAKAFFDLDLYRMLPSVPPAATRAVLDICSWARPAQPGAIAPSVSPVLEVLTRLVIACGALSLGDLTSSRALSRMASDRLGELMSHHTPEAIACHLLFTFLNMDGSLPRALTHALLARDLGVHLDSKEPVPGRMFTTPASPALRLETVFCEAAIRQSRRVEAMRSDTTFSASPASEPSSPMSSSSSSSSSVMEPSPSPAPSPGIAAVLPIISSVNKLMHETNIPFVIVLARKIGLVPSDLNDLNVEHAIPAAGPRTFKLFAALLGHCDIDLESSWKPVSFADATSDLQRAKLNQILDNAPLPDSIVNDRRSSAEVIGVIRSALVEFEDTLETPQLKASSAQFTPVLPLLAPLRLALSSITNHAEDLNCVPDSIEWEMVAIGEELLRDSHALNARLNIHLKTLALFTLFSMKRGQSRACAQLARVLQRTLPLCSSRVAMALYVLVIDGWSVDLLSS